MTYKEYINLKIVLFRMMGRKIYKNKIRILKIVRMGIFIIKMINISIKDFIENCKIISGMPYTMGLSL